MRRRRVASSVFIILIQYHLLNKVPSWILKVHNLPKTFCWTKIGPEAGEDVATIRQRKEWERQLGDGHFYWGVGQSLGNSPNYADVSHGGLRIVFSPMASKAKTIDSAPEGVLLWNAWIDDAGNPQPLPQHCFITSRSLLPSGRAKGRHYALVCASDRELSAETGWWISPAQLRNVGSNNSLGASQVTAIVRVTDSAPSDETASRYPVSFVADLKPPYVLRLGQPTLLNEQDLVQVRIACASGDVAVWRALVLDLRARVSTLPSSPQRTFEFDPIDAQLSRDQVTS